MLPPRAAVAGRHGRGVRVARAYWRRLCLCLLYRNSRVLFLLHNGLASVVDFEHAEATGLTHILDPPWHQHIDASLARPHYLQSHESEKNGTPARQQVN